jgi:hypothetical protein
MVCVIKCMVSPICLTSCIAECPACVTTDEAFLAL